MQLDKRSYKILDELLNNPSIQTKEMERKFNLTRRQLGYSFDKINEWLLSKNLPVIERTRQGHFIIDEAVFTKLNIIQESDSALAVPPEDQRIYFMIMMLLSREDLSLIHFTNELGVSKNTVLNDLKRAESYVVDYGLTIKYSRKYGYLIKGEEFQARKLLIHIMYKIMEMKKGSQRLRKLTAIKEDEVSDLENRINKVEKKLNLKFTDEKIAVMPYIFVLLLRRIKQGKKVGSFYIKYEELSDTKEYQATEEIFHDVKNIPMEERLFITLHLLTTNVYWSEHLTEETIPNLIRALDDMLRLFESQACITLQDRKQLLNKLLLHVEPAYYRIKYHLTEINDIRNTVSDEFKALHHLVQKSTKPLEDLIGDKIPESETTYLTMLIGGWLSRQGDSIREKVKAVVVCPRGVSVSRLMLSELRDLFPEFVFLDSLSLRQFKTFNLDYDIVFSPLFLETEKKLFIANSFLEIEEKQRLRKQVMQELYGYAPDDLNLEAIIKTIEKHAKVENRKELAVDLKRHFTQGRIVNKKIAVHYPKPNLNELITPNTITLKNSVSSWEEAITTAAVPLLRNGSITSNYLKTMIKSRLDPYIVIAPHTAIPHAAPEDGVNKLSMSMLRLKKGVHFTHDHVIRVVIVIAAADKEQHLRALSQLARLVADSRYRELIMEAQSTEEIHGLMKHWILNEKEMG